MKLKTSMDSTSGLNTTGDTNYSFSMPPQPSKPTGKMFLETLLNKTMKVEISDGRTLIGQYLCTDRDKNIILGSCQEFISDPNTSLEEPRILGLAMVPGRHVKSLHVDVDREFHSALMSVLHKDENRDVER